MAGIANNHAAALSSARWTAAMIGVGLMGAVDEIVFHQLLQWHHFYVHTTMFWQIASDGFFHIFTALLLFTGSWRLWEQRRRLSAITTSRPFWSGFFLAAGAFQLFDGLINHKVLRIHQVREGVDNLLPYDIGWNVAALLLLLVGWWLWRGERALSGS